MTKKSKAFFDPMDYSLEQITKAMRLATADGVVEERKSDCKCGHSEWRQVDSTKAATKAYERFVEAYPLLSEEYGHPVRDGADIEQLAMIFLAFVQEHPGYHPMSVIAKTYLLLTKAPPEVIH